MLPIRKQRLWGLQESTGRLREAMNVPFLFPSQDQRRKSERNEARGVSRLQIEPDKVKDLSQKRFVGKCFPDEPILSEVQTSDPATFMSLLQAEFFWNISKTKELISHELTTPLAKYH